MTEGISFTWRKWGTFKRIMSFRLCPTFLSNKRIKKLCKITRGEYSWYNFVKTKKEKKNEKMFNNVVRKVTHPNIMGRLLLFRDQKFKEKMVMWGRLTECLKQLCEKKIEKYFNKSFTSKYHGIHWNRPMNYQFNTENIITFLSLYINTGYNLT